MALAGGKSLRLIGGAKVNEHNSAMGRSRPFILHVKDSDVTDYAALLLRYADFTSLMATLIVPNALSSVSMNLPETLGGTEQFYKVAGKFDDWPEANKNRSARVLLGDATRRVTTSIDIPYLADGTSEDDIITGLGTFLTNYYVVNDPTEVAAQRMTDIIRVNIVTR